MELTIEQGNKYLARFMGYTSMKMVNEAGKEVKNFYGKIVMFENYKYDGFIITDEPCYHTSWEWIMPAVIKASNDFNIRIVFFNKVCRCIINRMAVNEFNHSNQETQIIMYSGHEPEIKNVWLAMVELLQKHYDLGTGILL